MLLLRFFLQINKIGTLIFFQGFLKIKKQLIIMAKFYQKLIVKLLK